MLNCFIQKRSVIFCHVCHMCNIFYTFCSWLNHKGVRQKRINDWLGTQSESLDE